LRAYAESAEAASGEFAQHLATRHQAMRIARYQGFDAEPFKQVFRMPSIVVFAGHMIDHAPHDMRARFPSELIPAVHAAI